MTESEPIIIDDDSTSNSEPKATSKAPKSWADKVKEEEDQEAKVGKKWYVIFNGPFKGIYKNWHIASQHINGKNVTHQSYPTKEEAELAFRSAYKTVTTEAVQRPPAAKGVSLGTPIKTDAKTLLERIMSTKDKEELKKPSSEKFARLWDNIVHYSEVHTTMGFYPRNRKHGPKAILLPGVEPLTAWDFFTHGFIDTLYIEGKSLQEVKEFPPKVQIVIKNYRDRFAKERQIFLQLYSSYPVFDEAMHLIVPSISLAYLGVSNGEYPTRDEVEETTPQQSHLIKALAGVYLGSSRLGVSDGQKNNIRINYWSRTLLIYSNDKQPLNDAGFQAIQTFEEPFEDFSDYLEILPPDFKKTLCQYIMHAPRHNCKYCEENVEEAPLHD